MNQKSIFEDEIILEAKELAKNILHEADQEAEKIISQARSEAKKIRKSIVIEKEVQNELEAQRELSKLRIQNNIELNKVKEQIFGEVLTESLKQIKKLQDQKSNFYYTGVTNYIINGGIALGGGDISIRLASKDVAMIDKERLESELSQKTGNKTTISIQESDASEVDRGVIIQKGSQEVNNTIEAIFSRREHTLRKKLHDILFVT
ncbi:MAG: V-type ATP synthase subunit E [Candidatus Hodarchaeales archaeon]|jgi:V/A-type H+-transporting ATPase subunit E